MKRLPVRRLSVLVIVAVAIGATVAAWAYFTSSGTGKAAASVGRVNPASSVTTQQNGSSIVISWTAASLSTNGSVQGYTVTRSDNNVICGSPTLVTTLSCTDSSPASGSATYTVKAVYHTFTASATSGSITPLTVPSLTNTPSSPSANSSPGFSFSGGGSSGYQCQIDGGGFSSCTSPRSFSGLGDGSHTFNVHAVSGGSTGPDATYTWTIDTSAPSITAKPSNPTNSSSATFSFSHSQPTYSTFQCKLDTGAFTSCTSSKTYTGLSDGPHSFQALAISGDGSVTSAATYSWSVDTSPPGDALSMASGATGGFINAAGTRIYFKGNASGSFKLIDTVSDSGSGPASATFPLLSTTGWTHAAEAVGAPNGGPYTSSTYSWTASASTPSGYSITSKDLAGNTSAGVTPAFVNDTTAPTSGALTVGGTPATAGGATVLASTTSFTIGARTDYSETQSTTASGLASSTLTVQSRTFSNGSCGSAAGPFVTPTTISNTTQPNGIVTGFCYVYTLTGTDNVGNAATISTTVEVDTSAPTDSLSLGASPTGAYLSSGNLYFKRNSAGSFKLIDTVSAPASGAASATFPSIATTGWTHASETVTTPGGGPFASGTFSWTANPSIPANYTVTSKSNAGITSSGSTLTFVADTTAPSGGALSVDGTTATAGGSSSTSLSTNFSIDSRTDYIETQSATASGLASSTLTVQSETLSGTTCGGAGSGGPFTTATTISGTTQPSGIQAGFCYLYTLTGTDNVGNTTSVQTTVTVPTQVSIASVVAANGGGSGGAQKIGANDAVTITFSGQLNESTICSTWSGTGAQSITGNSQVTVTLTDGGASNDTLTVSVNATGCPSFHFGTINLGSTGFITSGTLTYSGSGSNKSTINYSGGSTPTLTIQLGSGTNSSSVSSSTLTYTPDSSIKDPFGQGVIAGSSTNQTF